MTDEWQWDETLFEGSAPYYERGRLPYAPSTSDVVAAALDLDGRGRLIDVGCGPGIVALRLAHLFEEVVGVDPDPGMLVEAARLAGERGVPNTRWVRARGEDLPAGLGVFRVAVFARSFHWMDRDLVAARVFSMLEPGGAFVQLSHPSEPKPEDARPLPHPAPPSTAIDEVIHRYLGPDRRAGQGIRNSSPDREGDVLERVGFAPMELRIAKGREVIVRTVDDLVAATFSASSSAPHLFGDRLARFEADVRAVLAAASPDGMFAVRTDDTEVRMWRKVGR